MVSRHCWEIPGGKGNASESQPAALARELEEELAIKAVVGDYVATRSVRKRAIRSRLRPKARYIQKKPNLLAVMVALLQLERSHSAHNGKTPMERYFNLAEQAPYTNAVRANYLSSKECTEQNYKPNLELEKL